MTQSGRTENTFFSLALYNFQKICYIFRRSKDFVFTKPRDSVCSSCYFLLVVEANYILALLSSTDD